MGNVRGYADDWRFKAEEEEEDGIEEEGRLCPLSRTAAVLCPL
jgi:hypothetical protein